MFNPNTPSDTNLSTLVSLFTSKNWKFLIVEFRIWIVSSDKKPETLPI